MGVAESKEKSTRIVWTTCIRRFWLKISVHIRLQQYLHGQLSTREENEHKLEEYTQRRVREKEGTANLNDLQNYFVASTNVVAIYVGNGLFRVTNNRKKHQLTTEQPS